MTGLREEDSGHHWYRIYHASGRSVSKSVQFCPGVSLSEPLPWDPLAPFWCLLITEAWKPGCPPLAGSTGEVVGNTCPGDSHVRVRTHTHVHTHTHAPTSHTVPMVYKPSQRCSNRAKHSSLCNSQFLPLWQRPCSVVLMIFFIVGLSR